MLEGFRLKRDLLKLDVNSFLFLFSDFPASPNVSGRPSPHHSAVRSAEENGDIIYMKRRIFNHKVITVNFATNDVYFFSEMER